MPGFSQFLIQPDPTTKHSVLHFIVGPLVISTSSGTGRNGGQFTSEIARIEPRAEMDFAVLKALSDQAKAGRR